MPDVRREVAEIFGYPARSNDDRARQAREEFHCPFLKSRCIKQSTHRSIPPETPFGVCSVWHRGRALREIAPYIICPVRFTQENLIFHEAKSVLTVDENQYEHLLISEVGLPLGRLDYVIALYDRTNSLLKDFCLLEVMAVSTTTTGQIIRSMLDVLAGRPPASRYSYGINLRQVVSRMMIQALVKAYAAREWGVKTIWAIQDVLQKFIERETMLRFHEVDNLASASYPILFFVYGLDVQASPQYQLQRAMTLGGTVEEFEEALHPASIPSRSEMERIIRDRLQSDNYLNLSIAPAEAPPPPTHTIVDNTETSN